MVRDDDDSLQARLERLERMVEEIQRRLPPLPEAAAAAPASVPAQAYAPAGPPVAVLPLAAEDDAAERDFLPPVRGRGRVAEGVVLEPEPRALPRPEPRPGRAAAAMAMPKVPMDAQFWLNRLGIGVLLLGVALLFRYSIDQGWVTPGRRVAFGALLGAVLFGAGLRMDATRRRFVPVLLGGGIAVFYIVGFAAFNLYALVGYGAAFAGMVAVTVLAYAMALRKDEPVLAILGALGGLGTPLILGIDHGSTVAFSLYTSLILAWTSALYLMRGWKPVLWTSLFGGWILLVHYGVTAADGRGLPAGDRWVLQAAVVFAWAACGVLPFVRELRLRARAAGEGVPGEEERWPDSLVFHWHGLALLPPLLALLVTAIVWQPSTTRWGLLALGAAALYQGASMALNARDAHLARVLALSASIFLGAGSVAAFSGDALLVVLAAEAVALLVLARRHYGGAVAFVGHLLYAGAALWLLLRLGTGELLGARSAWADLAVVAAGAAISWELRGTWLEWPYRLFAHFAFLGWLWADLADRLVGTGWVATAAWAVYGAALFALGRRWGSERLERLGAWVAPLAVARLFLVDLDPVLHGEAVLLCLVAEALVLVLLARRYFGVAAAGAAMESAGSRGGAVAMLAHLLAAGAGIWTLVRLVVGDAGGPRHGWVDLAVIAAGLTLSFLVARPDRLAYRLFVHMAFLGWVWRALLVLPSGQAYATAAWAVYAVALLVVALRRDWALLERTATWTLILVVAKLFLVDLARLEAIWRILLFLGIGGGFLFLSYALQSWRRSATGGEEGEVRAAPEPPRG